jgi:predicted alpha/beta-fold hydrolase
LPGPHLPTLWAARGRRSPTFTTTRERLELPDGDFIDLVWSDASGARPLVLVLHGLEGGFDSPYVRRVMHTIVAHGWGACLLQFRGCSGEPNRLARSYHSGDTADLSFLLQTLYTRFPAREIGAIGYSMGGNVLLKWLGEQRANAGLAAAVAVSVPFDLAAAARRLDQGFSRFYQRHLLTSLRQKMLAKLARFAVPFSAAELVAARSFWRYDDCVTAPLHGFRDAADYYAQSSCLPRLHAIEVPTLIVHARNDPFLPATSIPRAADCAAALTLEVHARGGHVGFVTDPAPGFTRPWLEARVVRFLQDFLCRPRSGTG